MKKFNLPQIVTGRVAVNGAESAVVINHKDERNYYAGKDPVDFSKKLKGYAWETVVGKSGENTVTAYFLKSDNSVRIDSKFCKEYDGIRYCIEDMSKRGEYLDTPEVVELLSLRGKTALSKWTAKFDKAMSQGLSLAKDTTSRPTSPDDRRKAVAWADAKYAAWRREMLEEKDNTTTAKRTYGIIL